ncbi:hypothetical protein [Mycobacteroides abscessus]|uniref:hypothetical protein n=4 Tax=Mycobacteroides abscessus TaxID=36809 RepID=UPI0009A7E73F|nr:hypothetical protein [Mycobacteroides abscessus]SKI01919.1 Uncharacterised protein [Mycobacteroides abscessus subsp. massiliense]SKL87227.1 Uncharacterised protein [Mycobacteroides abscessus subsp. massiliense]SKU39315.1 Uncharacterised protein [Mycobacteroides abscessus subsp. massiliense]SLD98725.1 Uncharacterised protein [Mycobacteroides abscessus subsp. massiliense]SLE06708.1 Uncharacterised protein [Mycobacteroides abscessus subsp. massiliense]
MSGYARSTEQRAAVADHRDPARSAPTSQELLQDDPESGNPARSDPGRRLAAFAAGSVAAIGGIAALHGLYRSGDGAAELVGWAGLLLLAMTALGGGIKLAMWGVRPVITALFDRAKERLAEPVLAVVASGAVIVGALGMWWTFRGGYASWWQALTGESRWSLSWGVGQMLVAVAAGAALFTGGRYVTGLAKDALTDSGLLIERDRSAGKRRAPEGLWHPGLVAALIGGGLGLVLLAAGITPRLYVWITAPDVLPAVAAIVAVLLWAIGSNLGWWKGLAGLWQWATDASHKTAAMSGVVALLMFSAGGLGLGWFTPATVPQAHAQCPPDCGGGSNGGSYGPDASQFQPPQMPSQMPDYQGGINQPPLDQNGSISIYNTQAPSVSNNGVQGSSGQQGPQQSWDQPAHGTQIPDYQTATPYTQGPGRPNPDFNPGSDAGSQGGQPNQGVQQQAPQQPQENPAQQPDQQPQQSDSQRIDDLTRQLQDQQQSGQDRQRIDDLTKQLQQQGQQKQNGNQKLPKAPSKDKKQDDKDQQQDRDDQSQNNDLSALLLGAASTRRRKQDDPSQPDQQQQQQQQRPDTQALAQDGAQLGQSLPGDIANTVSDSVNLGQSAGSAAQNFGSAAQAGASLASSAQSGAVNPMDAVALVQGMSGGISDTADAVGSGASIASTWINNAGQGAQLAADANPQLKPQAEQVQQLTQAGGQVADLTGQVAGGVSQVSGMVNTASSLGASGMPDTSGVGDATDALSGTATAVNGPGDVPKPPTPPTPESSGVQALDSTITRAPQQPVEPSNPSIPKTANQPSTSRPLSPLEASVFPAPLQALNSANAGGTPNPNAGRLSSMPGVRDVSQSPQRLAPTLQPDQVDAFRAITRQNLENQNVPADQIEQRVNDAVKQAQAPRFMPDPEPMRTPGAQPLDRPLGDKFNDVMGRANDRAYDDIDGLGQLGKNLTGQGGPGAPGVAESWKDLGTNTVKGLPDAVGGGFVADGKRLYEEPGNFIGDKMVELPLAAVSLPFGGEGAAIERGALGDLASTETKAVPRGPVETPPVQLPAVDVPKPRLADYFQPGSPPKASELEKYALSQGWKKSQTPSGPAKYSDDNGIVRMTIKGGSQRAPGSELPHVELRDPNGQRIDPFGNPVARKSPDNHTAIGWDW